MEMIHSENVSPALPGFGRSPMVRQLRVTDSPFPLSNVDEDSHVDDAAEEFINRFYNDLRRQKQICYDSSSVSNDDIINGNVVLFQVICLMISKRCLLIIANVPNGADYDIWLPLALVHEVNDWMKKSLYRIKFFFFFKFASIAGVEYVLRNGPCMISGIPSVLNKWPPSVSLLKEELSHVPVWVKFHDVPLVAYTSDGLSLMATEIGTLMMFDSYPNPMFLDPWGRSSYARIFIEIDACNDFSDHLVMVVSNLEGNGYTKEAIPPKVASTRVVNQKDKGKSQTSEVNDEGFIKVKKKKLGVNNSDTKNFTFSVKQKLSIPRKQNNRLMGRVTLQRRLLLLIIEEVATSSMATTSGMQEEGQSSTPIINKINIFEKQIPKGKLMLVDDDGKPLEKVYYPVNLGCDDEVEPVEIK
nr:hypothetical protein [Tanacetum cinerariifolium]